MIVMTTEDVSGYVRTAMLGALWGMSDFTEVRLNRIPQGMAEFDFMHRQAYQRLVDAAAERGANAVVGLHFVTHVMNAGPTFRQVLCAYGTAAVLTPTAR